MSKTPPSPLGCQTEFILECEPGVEYHDSPWEWCSLFEEIEVEIEEDTLP